MRWRPLEGAPDDQPGEEQYEGFRSQRLHGSIQSKRATYPRGKIRRLPIHTVYASRRQGDSRNARTHATGVMDQSQGPQMTPGKFPQVVGQSKRGRTRTWALDYRNEFGACAYHRPPTDYGMVQRRLRSFTPPTSRTISSMLLAPASSDPLASAPGNTRTPFRWCPLPLGDSMARG